MAVFKDDKGRWGFSVRYIDAFGKRKQKKSVNKEWTKKQAKIEEEKFLNIVTSSAITVNDLREIYMQSCSVKLKENTIYQKEIFYNTYIESYFGKMRIDKVDERTVELWQIEIKKKNLKTSTLNIILGELMAMLHFAYRRRFIVRPIIAEKFKNDTPIENTSKTISKEQFDLICEEAMKINKTFYLLLQVLYYTGMRVGEALALTNKDIENNSISISKTYAVRIQKISSTKTNKARKVVISNRLLDLINEQIVYYRNCGIQKDLYIFGGISPISYNTIQYEYKKICDKLNITPTNIHSLRHTHVSNLIALGFNVFEISHRTGHSVEMINKTYGHVMKNPQSDMAEKLENL